MNRLCVILLVLALLTSCSSERMPGISDRAYEYGLAALETADEFMAGDLPADDAEKRLYNAKIGVDSCDGENDHLISSRLLLLQLAISSKDRGTSIMAEVEEERDALADLLGK